MILLDTSVVIEIVEQGAGYMLCAEQLERFDPREVHISAVSIFEVEVGMIAGSPNIRARRARWERFYRLLTYELVSDGVASEAASIVRATAKAGHQLGSMDALIAATAIEWGLTLATRDRDFQRVPGLKVEFWR
ncbi:type II toxin-antitoxin system VapC family toxin [Piscinibacter sp.]|uniref:type II toxin-antitoxin system VapC family toxin n=1 Tax=Piscinibacter sp. TaxID=1903157 RepID=UPI0039E53A4F